MYAKNMLVRMKLIFRPKERHEIHQAPLCLPYQISRLQPTYFGASVSGT
jgi:hypothetical protein